MRRIESALVLIALTLPVSVHAGDAYVKGAWLLHVVDADDEIDTDDRWWVGGGADWNVAPAALLGFEVSGAYLEDVIGGKIRSRVVPLDVSFNARWKPGSGTTGPYVGGGIGLASAMVWTDVAVPGFSSTFAWERALGYQAFGGVELSRRWLVEGTFRRTYATAASVQVNEVGPDHAFSVAAGVTW
jgi:hypothetical protein